MVHISGSQPPVDEQNALNYLTAVVRGRLKPSGPTSLAI